MSRRQQTALWSVALVVALFGLGWLGVATSEWAWFAGGLVGCIVGLVVGLGWRHFYTKVGRGAQRAETEEQQHPHR